MKNLFKKKHVKSDLEKLLDTVLYTFPKTGDTWTVAEATQGALVLGSPGSGKTSAVCSSLIYAMCKQGYGGLIPCVKSDMYGDIMKIIKATGRENDVIHFNEQSSLSFSPIEYELFNPRPGFGEVINIVNNLTMIIEVGMNYSSGGEGRSEEKFWTQAVSRFMNRCIHLLRLAGEPVTIQNMRRVMIHTFSPEDVLRYNAIWKKLRDDDLSEEEKEAIWKEYEEWCEENYFLYVFTKANTANLNKKDVETMKLVAEYFMVLRPKITEKTLAIIDETFLGSLAEPFLDGILKSHFSQGVSEELKPEKTFEEGKIIICDFPVKRAGISGIMANSIMSLAFKRVMETRTAEQEDNPKPAFLYVDEYQNLVAPQYDTAFQATARSALAMTIYATQNLNGLIGAMGRTMALDKAKSLAGNLGTKFFCANDSFDTNDFGSKMIGNHMANLSSLAVKEGASGSISYSQRHLPKVDTDQFTMLRTGRAENDYKVDAIVFKAGKKWRSGRNYLVAEFDQNFYKKK
jgi:hypothetical protein